MTAPTEAKAPCPLAVMDSIAQGIHPTRHATEFVQLSEARAKVAELVAAAREVADEHIGTLAATMHDGDDDDVGVHVCCRVISYKAHAPDCPAVRLRAALAAFSEVRS